MEKLFPLFMLLGFLSPCAAIVSAFLFYAHHCNRIEPDRRVPAIAFALAVIVCGAIGGYFSLFFGIEQACYGPTAPNLCGLWGFFVTGPIAFALAILAVGLALSLIQPMPNRMMKIQTETVPSIDRARRWVLALRFVSGLLTHQCPVLSSFRL